MTARPVTSATPLSERAVFLWGCLGFVLPYLAFFVVPIFFGREEMFRPEPLPVITPIAADLHTIMGFGRAWLDGQSPYQGFSLYPPLANTFFAVLDELRFTAAHTVLTATTLGLFLLLVVGVPLHYTRDRQVPPLLALFVVTGLLSYGLQFEIERGQFNMLAIGLTMCGVWIFHARPRWTILAYGLFSAGIHLKLYPAILVLLLTHDYRDHWGNLRRLLGLGAINTLLLFAGGAHLFAGFVVALESLAFKFGGFSINHSIYSFAHFGTETLARHMAVPASAAAIVEWSLLLYLLACLGAILALNHRDRQFGLDPYLLLACTIGAMVIPPISYDYKLSILVAPMALAVIEFERCAVRPSHPKRAGVGALVLMIAAYGSTLFSYDLKPSLLDNNCAALFVILSGVTAMAAMRSIARHGEPAAAGGS